MDDEDWMIEGTAHVLGLESLPDKIHDLHETERYAVFTNGERILLVPDDEVDP